MVKKTEELILDTVDDSPDKPVSVEKLLKWRKQGLSYSEIGNMIGRSKQAVHQRLQPYKDAIDNLPAFKENRADIFAIHQQRLLNSLTDNDIKRIPPGSRMTSFGILYDKERLERGGKVQANNQVQVNISFDPSLIPGSKGNVTIDVPTEQPKAGTTLIEQETKGEGDE